MTITCPFCCLFLFYSVGLIFSFSCLTCIKCGTLPLPPHPNPYHSNSIRSSNCNCQNSYQTFSLGIQRRPKYTTRILSYYSFPFYFPSPFFPTLWKLRYKFLGPRQDLGPWRRESESLGNVLETEEFQYRAKGIPYTSSV